jgi:hypothetical protein
MSTEALIPEDETDPQPHESVYEVRSGDRTGYSWSCTLDEIGPCKVQSDILFKLEATAAYDYGIHVGLYHM